MLLIGSAALNYHKFVRIPKDYDFIAYRAELLEFEENLKDSIIYKDVNGNKIQYLVNGLGVVEIEIAEHNNSAEQLLNILYNPKNSILISDNNYNGKWGLLEECKIASIPVLYTLKMSHRYLKNSPHFLKTMSDIHYMPHTRGMRFDFSIPDALKEWFKIREKETYNYSHPKLNQSKSDFFSDDNIEYIYDHDSIHEAVKIGKTPAYFLIKKNDADVFCSEKEFRKLPYTIQQYLVLEEAYVLALERHQIPNGFRPDPKLSFNIALEKICTSITSGWFREFAWENYNYIKNEYSSDYIIKFFKAKNNGLLIPYKA